MKNRTTSIIAATLWVLVVALLGWLGFEGGLPVTAGSAAMLAAVGLSPLVLALAIGRGGMPATVAEILRAAEADRRR